MIEINITDTDKLQQVIDDIKSLMFKSGFDETAYIINVGLAAKSQDSDEIFTNVPLSRLADIARIVDVLSEGVVAVHRSDIVTLLTGEGVSASTAYVYVSGAIKAGIIAGERWNGRVRFTLTEKGLKLV